MWHFRTLEGVRRKLVFIKHLLRARPWHLPRPTRVGQLAHSWEVAKLAFGRQPVSLVITDSKTN